MTRIPILKTYKLYIGGQFPRTESGRYYEIHSKKGKLLANVCLASRKDFRNAVSAALSAQPSWGGKTSYNRSQILYRVAEMLEASRMQFIEELLLMDFKKSEAEIEVDSAIDRLVYFAGWADKYQQIFSSVNPVASPFFNFSVLEPIGVVAIIAPEESPLVGLCTLIASSIVGGNAIVLLASEKMPLSAISLSEVLNNSDLPSGVVNILTGNTTELLTHFASHFGVKAIAYARTNSSEIKVLSELSSASVKRVILYNDIKNWRSAESENPYIIKDLQEVKTTWHPVENIAGGGNKY